MVPPQESPTFQAVSSATPNSSIFGFPESITSSASVTTAPSTQPPETEPRKLPSWSMTRLAPTGRGAEPQVSTTVASATARPSLRQSSAALRISLSVESMVPPSGGRMAKWQVANWVGKLHGTPSLFAIRHFLFATFSRDCHSLCSTEYKQSGDLLHPGFRVPCPPAAHLQRGDQIGDRVEIVDGAEFVYVRQHGLDAAGAGLEAIEAQQRIEPDEPPAGAMQPVHIEGERIVDVAVEPVGDQKHDRALTEHTTRPQPVKGMERRGDAGAARPVRNAGRAGGERIVRIALAQGARHVGEARAEQKGAHTLTRV